jgi:hypothetical protein
MRPAFCFLSLAALAACDAPQPPANDAAAPANETAAAPGPGGPVGNEAASPAAEPAVAPPGGAVLPASFHGIYDASREACAASSQERLRVEGGELRFHESSGKVVTVTAHGPRRLSVVADYQGEGESWRSTRELELSDDGATLTISGDGTRLVRVRCP